MRQKFNCRTLANMPINILGCLRGQILLKAKSLYAAAEGGAELGRWIIRHYA
jgi:hypothetical protein